MLDKSRQIDLQHLQAARAVWDYCDASAAYIFGDSLGDRIADDIARALDAAGPRPLSAARSEGGPLQQPRLPLGGGASAGG